MLDTVVPMVVDLLSWALRRLNEPEAAAVVDRHGAQLGRLVGGELRRRLEAGELPALRAVMGPSDGQVIAEELEAAEREGLPRRGRLALGRRGGRRQGAPWRRIARRER